MTHEDEIGPWSEDKLNLLRRYLEAYVTIMRNQASIREYHYVDAFAGTGRPRARDEERYVAGSPRIALSLKYPFNSYTFIEKKPWRIARLEELRQEFPDRDIRIRPGDSNRIITSEITIEIRYERFARGLIFLDPFGMEVEWSTIQSIAETRALEIVMNFPTMALNRTVLPNDPRSLTRARIEKMNRFWGTEDWRADIYEEIPSLFGPVKIKLRKTTAKRLGLLFKARLGEVFPHVTEPLVMKNSSGAPLYCLFLASHKQTGRKIMTDIFRSYERFGS